MSSSKSSGSSACAGAIRVAMHKLARLPCCRRLLPGGVSFTPCVARNVVMFSNASCDTSLRPQLASGVPIGLAVLVARNVVAAEAAVPAQRSAGHVFQLPLRPIRRRHAHCSATVHPLFTVAGRSFRDARPSQYFGGQLLRERRAEPNRRQILERLALPRLVIARGSAPASPAANPPARSAR